MACQTELGAATVEMRPPYRRFPGSKLPHLRRAPTQRLARGGRSRLGRHVKPSRLPLTGPRCRPTSRRCDGGRHAVATTLVSPVIDLALTHALSDRRGDASKLLRFNLRRAAIEPEAIGGRRRWTRTFRGTETLGKLPLLRASPSAGGMPRNYSVIRALRIASTFAGASRLYDNPEKREDCPVTFGLRVELI
jgi:hypothetical protein